jgi:hypothetical protein
MTDHLEKIQNLTKDYAAYSRTAIGLGYLVASILLPVCFFIAKSLPINLLGAILGALLSFSSISLWLWLRQQVSSRLYQGFGVVRAALPLLDVSTLVGLVVGTVIGTGLVLVLRSSGLANIPDTFLYAIPAFLVGLILAWLDFKQHGDRLGLTTLLFAGVVGGGLNSNADNLTEIQRTVQQIVLVVAPVLIAYLGIRQHNDYKRLEQAFKDLSQGQP